MIKGYNLNYEFMRPVYRSASLRRQVVDHLLQLPVNQKVLRFPGGTSSRSWNYSPAATEEFAQLCKEGGVKKITFVANMADLAGSVQAALHLRRTLQLVTVEAGNEEYRYQVPSNFWEGLLLKGSAFLFYYVKGRSYGQQVKALIQRLTSAGITDPVSVCLQLPNDQKNQGWKAGVEAAVNTGHAALHYYWLPVETDHLERNAVFMDRLNDYHLHLTEVNSKWDYPLYHHLAYSPQHRLQLVEAILSLSSRPNVKTLQIHSYQGHSNFCRLEEQNGELVDRYAGWYDHLLPAF